MPVGDQPGWRQVYTDDFNGDAVNDNWGAYSGSPGGDPYSWWDPGHVTVGGSKLVLEGYQENGQWVTGGVSNWPVSLTYGKWEVRFRADPSDEVTFHFLLWPRSGQWPPEIDFLENFGGDRSTGSGFVHYVMRGPGGTGVNSKIQKDVTADFTTWQTVGVEWLPDRVTYTLNGEPWAEITGEAVPSEAMWLGLQAQAGGCQRKADAGWPDCPAVGTPDRADIEIDWMTAYATM